MNSLRLMNLIQNQHGSQAGRPFEWKLFDRTSRRPYWQWRTLSQSKPRGYECIHTSWLPPTGRARSTTATRIVTVVLTINDTWTLSMKLAGKLCNKSISISKETRYNSHLQQNLWDGFWRKFGECILWFSMILTYSYGRKFCDLPQFSINFHQEDASWFMVVT